MRYIIVFALLLCVAAGGQAFACDGAADVVSAFVKQKKSAGWRAVVTSKGVAGAQEQTSDYLPPDRMYRKIVVAGQEAPLETIGIGTQAWSNSGDGWDELTVGYAQLVVEHIRETIRTAPAVSVEYTCLGETSFEGKPYLGYQTKPEKSEDGVELARTIYVDPATGLPAFNVIGPPGGGGELLMKEAFSYPTDLSVEKPY